MSFTLGLLPKDSMGKTSSVLPPFSLHSCLTLQQQTWHPQRSPVALLLMAASCLTSHGHPHRHHTFCLKPFTPQGLQELHREEEKLPGGTFLQRKPLNPNSSRVPEEAKAATQLELPLPFPLYHPLLFSSGTVYYHLPNSSLMLLCRSLKGKKCYLY